MASSVGGFNPLREKQKPCNSGYRSQPEKRQIMPPFNPNGGPQIISESRH